MIMFLRDIFLYLEYSLCFNDIGCMDCRSGAENPAEGRQAAARFALSDFLRGDEVFHIARVTIRSRRDLTYHCHDYAEILWIESGAGVHFINGREVRAGKGDLFMMRPDDCHTFWSSGEGMTLINMAFRAETLDFLHERYFRDSAGLFWTESEMPFQMFCSEDIIRKLSLRAEETMRKERNLVQQDSMLLFVFRNIMPDEKGAETGNVPGWFQNALRLYGSPEYFIAGTDGFADLCGRTSDHVNRVSRRFLGKTLVELVTEARMRYAAAQLSLTEMPVKEICRNCGYANLAHFYKIFVRTYGMPPKTFRDAGKKIGGAF